jgi:hypothetical protein
VQFDDKNLCSVSAYYYIGRIEHGRVHQILVSELAAFKLAALQVAA